MVLVEIFKKCSRCLDTGVDNNLIVLGEPISEPCAACGGTGKVNAGWIDITDLMDRFGDIDSKADSIIAEQASQREDLTAALSQIWNKVKTL
jgi:hypothetical protein